MIDLPLNGAGEAETERDALVDNGQDQARADTLVLRRNGIRENERRGGERRVHTHADDEDAEEKRSPIDLADWPYCYQDGPDGICHHSDKHHPCRSHMAEQLADGQCRAQSRGNYRAVPCGEQQGTCTFQLGDEISGIEDLRSVNQ